MYRFIPHIRAAAAFLCILVISSGAFPREASAFKIFGMSFFEDEEGDTAVSDPVRYSVTIRSADKDTEGDIEDASALFQDREKPVSGDLGVVIKARDDRDRILSTLYEQSRYGALVHVKVNGVDIDALPPVPEFPRGKPVPVEIVVDPGPVYTVDNVYFKQDAAKFAPGEFGLKAGEPAGAGQVIRSAGQVVESLEKEGRPLARLTGREVAADHETKRVDVTVAAEGGPVADYGPVEVDGSKTVDHNFIARWSRLRPGEQYDPEAVSDATERLRNLGVFSSISITKADRLDANGQIPMTITVADGKQRYYGGGAQFSSIEGFGLSAYWGHRNLLGNAESLRISGAISGLGTTLDYRDLEYSTGIVFSKPAAFSDITTFNAGIVAATARPDTYKTETASIYANVAFDLSRRDTASIGVDLTANQTRDVFGKNRYLIASLPLSYTRDGTDNKLDPTEGYKLTLNVNPSYEFKRSTPFSSIEGSVSGYYGVGEDDSVVFAGKFSAGSLLGVSQLADVPAIRRFYAGGGGSVRGYGYQEISPRNGNGDATGGRSYAISSLEARIKVTEKIGIVPFADIGHVGKNIYPDFSDLRIGYGIGLRYATGLGPIRVDLALPAKRYDGGSRFGIYAGIGQSF